MYISNYTTISLRMNEYIDNVHVIIDKRSQYNYTTFYVQTTNILQVIYLYGVKQSGPGSIPREFKKGKHLHIYRTTKRKNFNLEVYVKIKKSPINNFK